MVVEEEATAVVVEEEVTVVVGVVNEMSVGWPGAPEPGVARG